MTNLARPIAKWIIGSGAVAAGLRALLGGERLRRTLRAARNDHSRRPALWNRFYALDWGETATNNYGFAPAEGEHPQRFQHQMYRELLGRLQTVNPLDTPVQLLEVSCGRGGGLKACLAAAPPTIDTTGLDVAASAIAFCRRAHAGTERVHFVQGNALDLPFPDASFDVVLNVEASNDYGDRARFFAEVSRVLKPGGVFLYADSFKSERVPEMRSELAGAGFAAEFDDITANVAEACRLDTPRRLALISRHAPIAARMLFERQLHKYAGVEGSKKHLSFVDGRRRYLMTAAVRR
jgi:SAM-dependent methyltransferase